MKTINLTFHRINAKFDDGKIINKKVINIQNKNSVDIMQLYSKNFKFIVKSLNMLNKKKLLESIQNQKITTKNLLFRNYFERTKFKLIKLKYFISI